MHVTPSQGNGTQKSMRCVCVRGGGEACVVSVQKQDHESTPLEVRIMLTTGGPRRHEVGLGGWERCARCG